MFGNIGGDRYKMPRMLTKIMGVGRGSRTDLHMLGFGQASLLHNQLYNLSRVYEVNGAHETAQLS